MKKIIFGLLIITSLAFLGVQYVGAQDKPSDKFELNVAIENPLGNKATSLKDVVALILKTIVDIALPIVIVMVIYSGFLYVTALGNSDKLKTAHQTITWTLVGAAVLLGAQLISTVLIDTVQNISKDAGLTQKK